MKDDIVIRRLESMEELTALVGLQKAVWGMRDVEVSSPHTLRAIAHSGGAVIGAESRGRMIGFCFGFAALRDGELSLWSHMAAVAPGYQGRGVGFRLKQAQREWALRQGIRLMAWTFDPMQAGNANFNFNRLGATARRYSADHYGAMQDGLNAGLASDRLEAHWQLDAPHVIALAEGAPPPPPNPLPQDEGGGVDLSREPRKIVYLADAGRLRHDKPALFEDARYRIEIPLDIAELKRRDLERARLWQMCVRETMIEMLAARYIVSGFSRQGDKAWYVLSRQECQA